MILMLLLCLCTTVSAQQPPKTDPASTEQRIVLAYDRGTMPGEVVLWGQRTVLGYNVDPSYRYSQIHLVCKSATDSASGMCPVSDTHESGDAISAIPVRFTERRSGLRTDVAVRGWVERADTSGACFRDFWFPGKRPIWTSARDICGGEPGGTGAALSIPVTELEKLVAGRWDATLELDLYAGGGGVVLASHKFTFELTITDQDRANIYFPASDNVTPLVNLNINYMPVPSPAHIEGGTSLDMCLYDGLGSQIPYLEVSIRDDGTSAPGRAPGMHSVWHRDGGHGNESRLDYEVTLDYGGVPLRMENNVMQRLNGIDTTQLRLVVLPGMSQPVYCVPTPLKLRVPRVLAADKLAGYYEGQMIIQMIVPSATP